jgi:hypothetical protein
MASQTMNVPLIQALIPKLAIEAFSKRILNRPVGLNKVQSDPTLEGPGIEGMPCEPGRCPESRPRATVVQQRVDKELI